MKRRIFVYHTLTVLAALVTLLVVSGGVMGWVTHRYQEWSRSAIDDRAEQVQTLLSDSSGTDWGRLDAQLRELGYHLRVCQNGRELYSSLDPFQENAYQRFSADAVWPPNGTHTIQNDGILMIGTQNGPYTIVAMSRPHIPEVFGRQRPQSEAVMLALITSGLTAIVLIVLLSLLFTNHQVKQLMRPVNALADAAQRVERGDLSRPVDYHGKDEFASVCAAFDHMQRHLLAEREKNAAYEQARTDLVAGISHDLRTPLTAMIGYLELLQALPLSSDARRYTIHLEERTRAMKRLTQELLAYSAAASVPALRLQSVDLRRALEETLLAFYGAFESRGITPQLHLTERRVERQLDPDALSRVLGNILTNALRHGEGDLFVSLEENGTMTFSNTASGLDSVSVGRLFDRFYTVESGRGSSGLGLSIAKLLTEQMGGKIHASFSEGRLTVTLLFGEKIAPSETRPKQMK